MDLSHLVILLIPLMFGLVIFFSAILTDQWYYDMNLLLHTHENVNDPVWSVIFGITLVLIGTGYYIYILINYDNGKNDA